MWTILIAGILAIVSCNDGTSTVSEFIIENDLVIREIAREPLLVAPVAMQEDEFGRIWVAEMTGYMRDIEGENEDLPDGRIVILSDEDEDGVMDKRTVFLDSLENPRAVSHVYGGLLYTSGTALLWTPVTDDGPGAITIVDSVYVIGGNIEHQPNGLLYNLDNWIYSAKSNARYRRADGEWIKEATTFRGQWGISMDEKGRLIYNHNSLPMAGDHVMPNVLLTNDYLSLDGNMNSRFTDDLRIFPIQPVAVNRGYIDGQLDERGHVINTTSACAPHIFYGDALGEEYYGRGFVCMPEGNLLATYALENRGLDLDGARVSDSLEFLVSTDETFRPVNLATGLDGSLLVLDMRKGIIQHRAYMSDYLYDKILDRGLDKVTGKGRIYRITAPGSAAMAPDFSDWVALLEHENLAVRMYAQREIVGREMVDLGPELQSAAKSSETAFGQVHALWALEGLGMLTDDLLVDIGSDTEESSVAIAVMILLDLSRSETAALAELCAHFQSLESREVDHLLAHFVGRNNDWALNLWKSLAEQYSDDDLITESLVSGIAGKESEYLKHVPADSKLDALMRTVIKNRYENNIQAPQLYEVPFEDNRTAGLKLFKTYCAACHGMSGKGQKDVAPSLSESEVFEGSIVRFAEILLEGYTPASGDYLIPMPAYKNDPKMTNEAIHDLVSYLRSTFRTEWGSLSDAQIDSLRAID